MQIGFAASATGAAGRLLPLGGACGRSTAAARGRRARPPRAAAAVRLMAGGGDVPSAMQFAIVVAMDQRRGIGRDGNLPWPRLRGDLQHFRRLTIHHAVLMGRKTYDSLPVKHRPLRERLNVVITRDAQAFRARDDVPADVLAAGSLPHAVELLQAHNVQRVFVIGGAEIYRLALQRAEWSQRLYITEIHDTFDCDTFFSKLDDSQLKKVGSSEMFSDNGVSYRIVELCREKSALPAAPAAAGADGGKRVGRDQNTPPGATPPESAAATRQNGAAAEPYGRAHGERQYLDLIEHILRHGNVKEDRTGVGTRSVFGAQMRFDLRRSFPLLTTKRVFWRGVVEELLWFVRGCTDSRQLSSKNVRIWDANGSRENLDRLGFTEREEGDLGPVYGFQWRHFGASYRGWNADYTGEGVDQLENVVKLIRERPDDRRILLSAWNPMDLHKMVLPPCHVFCQFYVANGELSSHLYQRSCDMGLGVPFNIASYALLTCMLAELCGLRPGDFVHTLGDAHVYLNHVDALQEQLERSPRDFPRLTVRSRARKGVDDFVPEDFELVGYRPHPPIAMSMAV